MLQLEAVDTLYELFTTELANYNIKKIFKKNAHQLNSISAVSMLSVLKRTAND